MTHALITTATPSAIARAVELLAAGELVAFPTETVYGLGADAGSRDAVARIFAAKGRPADHPVIVHLAQASDVAHWARDVPPDAQSLADAFWPGPLTLILPRASHVDDIVTGGQDTIGVRVPAHPVARELLAAFACARASARAARRRDRRAARLRCAAFALRAKHAHNGRGAGRAARRDRAT